MYNPDFYNCPVAWQFVDSMMIIQQPDFLILGDRFCAQFKQELGGSLILNPGDFSKNGNFCILKL